MSDPARKLLHDALALSEDERLELASDLIASVDGPSDWVDVRAQILGRLGRT